MNLYAPGSVTVQTPNGQPLTLTQATDYPRDGRVTLTVRVAEPEAFTLRLRIPGWCDGARVDGAPVVSGAYHALTRTWQSGDEISLDLPLDLWIWVGERDAAGKASLYRGPLLLAWDPHFNPELPTETPQVAWPIVAAVDDSPLPPGAAPLLRVRVATAAGESAILCDFATAGLGGNPYASWLPIEGPSPVPFTRENPLRRGPAA